MMKQKNRNIFRCLRQCLALNLNEMAERCGISKVYISELERGLKTNPSKCILEKYSAACGIKVETIQFFMDADSKNPVDYAKLMIWGLMDHAKAVQIK